MPKRKKKAHELTTDEALNRLFPKEAVEKLKELASEPPKSKKSKNETTQHKEA